MQEIKPEQRTGFLSTDMEMKYSIPSRRLKLSINLSFGSFQTFP